MKPPDLVPLVVALLSSELDVPVSTRRPEQNDGVEPPARFVVVVPTGGAGRSDRVLQGLQLTFDCYAPTGGTARTLAMALDGAMYGLPVNGLPVSKVTGSTPAADVDPDTEKPRYTATYQLTTITN